MTQDSKFDIAFVGHYTKDTIIYPHQTQTQDGGSYFFGASVAAKMGKKVAVITRLAQEDWRAVEKIEKVGVQVFAHLTPSSSCLNLIYPSDNMDERTIELTGWAGPFVTDDVVHITANAYAIVASSVRGEVPVEVVQELSSRGTILALDVQGFIRILQNGKLGYDDWPGKEKILRYVTLLKVDAVEAKLLTGESDRRAAALKLAEYGPREILLTNSQSIVLYHDGEFDEAPLVPKSLKGRSGRGDTCTGAYLSRRLSASPKDSLFWAAAVTSLKLEEEGPFNRSLTDVEELYNSLIIQAN